MFIKMLGMVVETGAICLGSCDLSKPNVGVLR